MRSKQYEYLNRFLPFQVNGFSTASGFRTIPFRNYDVRGDLRIDVVGFMPFSTL